MRQLPPPRLQFDRTRVPAGIRSAPSQGASLAVGPQSTGYDPHRIIGGRISRGPHQSASAWSASGPRVDPRALARQQENTARIRGRMGAFMRAVAHKSLFDRAAPGGNPGNFWTYEDLQEARDYVRDEIRESRNVAYWGQLGQEGADLNDWREHYQGRDGYVV